MADETRLTADFMKMVEDLFGVVREHAAILRTIVAYVGEQPAQEREKFEALYAAQRAQLQLPPVTGLDGAQQALLRAFQGPVH